MAVQFLPKELWGGISSLSGSLGQFAGALGERASPAGRMDNATRKQPHLWWDPLQGDWIKGTPRSVKKMNVGYDPNNTGNYTFATGALPAGYEPMTNYGQAPWGQQELMRALDYMNRGRQAPAGQLSNVPLMDPNTVWPPSQQDPLGRPPPPALQWMGQQPFPSFESGGGIQKPNPQLQQLAGMLGLARGEFPAVLHEGEVVLNKDAVGSLGGMASANQLNSVPRFENGGGISPTIRQEWPAQSPGRLGAGPPPDLNRTYSPEVASIFKKFGSQWHDNGDEDSFFEELKNAKNKGLGVYIQMQDEMGKVLENLQQSPERQHLVERYQAATEEEPDVLRASTPQELLFSSMRPNLGGRTPEEDLQRTLERQDRFTERYDRILGPDRGFGAQHEAPPSLSGVSQMHNPPDAFGPSSPPPPGPIPGGNVNPQQGGGQRQPPPQIGLNAPGQPMGIDWGYINANPDQAMGLLQQYANAQVQPLETRGLAAMDPRAAAEQNAQRGYVPPGQAAFGQLLAQYSGGSSARAGAVGADVAVATKGTQIKQAGANLKETLANIKRLEAMQKTGGFQTSPKDFMAIRTALTSTYNSARNQLESAIETANSADKKVLKQRLTEIMIKLLLASDPMLMGLTGEQLLAQVKVRFTRKDLPITAEMVENMKGSVGLELSGDMSRLFQP